MSQHIRVYLSFKLFCYRLCFRGRLIIQLIFCRDPYFHYLAYLMNIRLVQRHEPPAVIRICFHVAHVYNFVKPPVQACFQAEQLHIILRIVFFVSRNLQLYEQFFPRLWKSKIIQLKIPLLRNKCHRIYRRIHFFQLLF
ncbi:unknown [Ruminococcus sp. CAG:57]|nr:unknown [Ruminococcus sp. CAG:57]